MKKLPNIYKGSVRNSNNLKSAHVSNKKIDYNPRDTINNLFRKNEIYKQDVEIETDKDNLKTKIVGRTEDHVITIDNIVIKIDNIKRINILD
jgi:hypothetical protein